MIKERRRSRLPVFDIIYLDFQMPKMTGPDTSKAIRKLLRQGKRGPLVHRQERPIICGMTALSHQEVFSVATDWHGPSVHQARV